MALYTKKLIMSTFQEMLEELPFDKITVAALVKRADISPNTFYYHYQDIYALLDAWFRERAETFIPSNAPIEWKSTTKLCCINAKPIRKQFIMCLMVFPATIWSGISFP